MPLKVAIVNGNCRPVIHCDHCRLLIETAAEGNYQWLGLIEDGQEQPIFFTHKTCLPAFEASSGGLWGAELLEFLPELLINNLGIDRGETEKRFVRATCLGLFGK